MALMSRLAFPSGRRLAARPLLSFSRSIVARRALTSAQALCRPQPRVSALARAVGAAAATAAAAGLSAVSVSEPDVLSRADALFDANEYSSVAALLRQSLSVKPDEPQLLWRLARGLKKLADAEKDKAAKEKLVNEAFGLAERALKAGPDIGPVHKWYAITLSDLGGFKPLSEKIKSSFVVRDHFALAAELSPKDATARHLLGLWCFEVAKLSWIEQKAAAAFFASPPKATFEEALGHFVQAEQIEPGFYPKNKLLAAQALAKLGRTEEAKKWLDGCLASPAKTPEDEATLMEARKLRL